MVQVVPVLFIAVMIEFRYLLKTSADDNDRFHDSRGYRASTASLMLVVSGLLVVSFILGVLGLRDSVPRSDFSANVAAYALVLAAVIAIVPPSIFLFAVSTADTWVALYRRMPWSETSRRQNKVQSGLEEDARSRREAASVRRKYLMEASETYVIASYYERAIPRMLAEDQPKARVAVDEIYGRADRTLETIRDLDDMLSAPMDFPRSPRMTDSETAFFRGLLALEVARSTV